MSNETMEAKRERLCPALEFASVTTAHIHLNLALCKVHQAADLLERCEGFGRLAVELRNVAEWLDDSALTQTGRAVEAARI